YDFLCEQLLDRYDYDAAILTGEELSEISSLANPYYASALCSAYNDWLIDSWLPRDPRLKGSIWVAPQNPQLAAQGVRRLGDHPDMGRVRVSTGSKKPYGDPFYWPVWEAAAEFDLPVAAHLGGESGINAEPTACGPSTFFWEHHAMMAQMGMVHLASTI